MPAVAILAIMAAGIPVAATSAHHARVRPLAQLALANAARGHRLPSTVSPSEGSSVSNATYGIFLTGSVTAREIAATGARPGTIEPVGATAYGTLGQLQALAQLPGVNEVDIAGAPQKELDQSVPATHAAEPGHGASAGVPHVWSGTGGSTAHTTGGGLPLWHFSGPCEGGGGKTPVLYGGKLYVRDPINGNKIFPADSNAVQRTFSAGPAPAFDGSTGFYVSAGVLSAEDPAGTILWQFSGDGTLNSAPISAPIVVNHNVFVGAASGKVFAIPTAGNGSPVNATPTWTGAAAATIAAPDEQNVSQPLTGLGAGNGLLIVPASTKVVAFGDSVVTSSADTDVAYQIDSGHDGDQPLDSITTPLAAAPKWSVDLGGPISYPLIAAGKVFVTAGNTGGSGTKLYALNQSDGSVAWGPKALGGAFLWSAVTYENGKVFAINHDGLMTAFTASDGSTAWSQQLAPPPQYAFSSPPTARNGVVYVGGAGTGGAVYAVDEISHAILWTAPVQNGDESSPAVSDTGVYVSYSCPQVYDFSPGTFTPATLSTLTGDTGKNVVVGVVDSGIDLGNPDFKTSVGTRIKSLWDQSGNSPNPTGFGYGAECASATIDGGTCNETDSNGHGTHVVGIAASNGRAGTGGQYIGMAPESDIVAVKIDPVRGTLANIVDGVNYVYQKAAALGEPASVNLSLGVGFGPHDGTSLFEQLLDGLTGPGKLLSVAAGNTGRHVAGSGSNNGLYYHASGNVPQGQTRALNLRIGGSEAVLFDLWYPAGEQLGVTVRGPGIPANLPYVTPNDPTFGNPQGGNGYLGSCGSAPAPPVNFATYTDPSTGNTMQILPCQGVPGSIDSETQVYISDLSGLSSPSGCPCFENWSISLQGTAVSSGAFNAWTSDQGDYVVSNNGANSSNLGNDASTLAPPATAHNVIAVGSSTDRSTWADQYGHVISDPLVTSGRSQVGALSFFSSLGPTRDGRRGIDIVAPGEMIGSSLSANASAAILQGCGVTDTVNGQPACLSSDGAHLFIQGTSMAAPHVAGALALILQQVPTLTVAQARRVLGDSAGVDGNTGGVPNASWGTGKLQLGPGVTSITPLHAARDTSPQVTLCGFDFQAGMTAAYRAPGNSTFTAPVPVTVQSGCFHLTLAPATTAGTVDIRMTNPDTSSGTDTAGFTLDYTGPWRVAGIGGDNAAWSEDAGDTNFHTLAGAALGAPALYSDSVTGGSGQIVTGGDHDLWVNNGVAGWQRLTSGGPVYCTDNPAVVIPPGSSTLYVGCRGGDNALWTAVTPAPAWGVNPSVPASAWHRAGGVLTAGPAVAPVDASVQFFVLGGDNHVWTNNSGTNSFTQMSWLCQGHPAVATTKDDTLTFFACHGSDGALWWAKRPTGGAWGAASSLGGLIVDGPAVAPISASKSPIFFAEGSDRRMWTRTDSLGWSPLGGIFQHGAGAIGS